MKPKFSLFKSRRIEIGSTLVAAITFCFGSHAFALDNFWTGSVSTDWNTAGNWSLGRVPINPNGGPAGDNFDDAVVNVKAPRIATITANVPVPRDFRVGQGAGGDGRLDQLSGTATTGAGNWTFIGRDGGTGVFNLANTAGTGGVLTGFAQGSGSFTCNGSRLYVGGGNDGASNGNGTLLMHTSGTLTIGNDLAVGSGTGAVGVMKVDSGTITTGGWNFIGKNENGPGADGKLYMSGGTLTNTGRTYIGQEGSTGLLELTGGSYRNVNNEILVAGENAGSNGTITINNPASVLQSGGELWLGQFENSPTPDSTGVLNLIAGTVTVNNWLAIGRWGTGTVNQSGGTITKTGGGSVTISNFGTAVGVYNLSGGLLDIQSGNLIVGEGGNGTAELTMTGGQINAPEVRVGTSGGVVATVAFNGGTLTTGIINGAGGGTSNVTFNGTQIVASAPQATFIANLDSGEIGAGGLKIDSNGKSISFDQVLSGTGGLVKSGTGTLTVNGAQLYSGATTVNAGKLVASTEFEGGGNFTVADGAALGVLVTSDDVPLVTPVLRIGTAGTSSLDFNLGNQPGNASVAPLNAGQLILGGTVTINVEDAAPGTGTIPLIEYGTKTGTNFVLGTLPLGVVATLEDDGAGTIFLDVTSVALPLWQGKTPAGTVTGVWDVETTQNWYDLALGGPSTFKNNAPVLFDDDAANVGGTTDVILNVAVTPSLVTFGNSAAPYTLTGTGKITGTGGVTNAGTGEVTLSTANDYTGVTTFQGGTTIINSITNGGVAGPLGAATASPSNLAFAGGTLSYTGPNATTDRGILVSGTNNTVSSTLSVTNSLTLSGPVTAPVFGRLVKAGPGTLTLTNPANVLSVAGFRVAEGTVALTGPGQTNSSGGPLTVGTGASLLLQDSTLTNVGDNDIGNNPGPAGTLTLNGTSSYTSANRIMLGVGSAEATGVVVVSGSGTLATGGWLSIGQSGTGSLTLKDSGKVTCTGDFNVTDLVGSRGSFTLQDSASVVSGSAYFGKGAGSIGSATISGGTFTATGGVYVASGAHVLDGGSPPVELQPPSAGTVTQTGGIMNLSTDGGETQIGSRGVGIWNQSGGVINSRGWLVVGRYPDGGSSGTLNLSGNAVLNQLTPNRFLIIGEETTGVVTLSGNAQLNAMSDTGIMISNSATGDGTLNLDGGILTTKGIRQGAGGASTFNFNGGLLKAATGANANFFTGIGTVNVKPGGALIDTNGNNISFNQALLDEGGVISKTGAGTLYLNSSVDLEGLITVNQGTLGGTGLINGPVLIKSGADLNPGDTIGTLSVRGLITFEDNTTLTIQADATGSDQLVTLDLNVSNAGLVIQGSLSQAVYPIATYDTLAGGGFKSITGLPGNYQINYSYVNPDTGETQIALIRQGTPIDGWLADYFPGVSDPAIIGPDADPDGDGSSNLLEFALGGVPNDGSRGPIVHSLIADTADTGAEKELLITIAVRGGTPAAVFTNGTAVKDAITYTIQGSLDLADFASPVSEVTPAVTTGLPGAPAGYEYRTFRLNASNGLGGKGFLRVQITP